MPPKNKITRKIKGSEFEGEENLSAAEWSKLVVDSLTNSAAKLFPAWTGDPVVIPGMTLSNDNSKASNLNVFVQGDLLDGKAKAVLASRFWPMQDNNVYLSLPTLPGDIFKFSGSLTSDLLDSSRIEHAFTRAGNPLPPEEATDLGAGNFCLKLHLRPTQATWVAFSVSLFPSSQADLLEHHPLATNGAFPGICISAGELKLQPRSAEKFVEKATGCPVLPALRLGGTAPISLTIKEVKAALAALFRKALLPENKQNHSTLLPRWSAIQECGVSKLLDGTPELMWPLPTEVAATVNLGKNPVGLPPPPAPPLFPHFLFLQ